MTTVGVLSLSDDNVGAEEDEATVNIINNRREDLATGLLLIGRDNAATILDAPLQLLAHHPLPCQGSLLQRDDGTAGTQNVAASATTPDKFGIIAHAMASRGALLLGGRGCHNTNSCSRTVFQEAGGTIRVPSTLSHIIEHTGS